MNRFFALLAIVVASALVAAIGMGAGVAQAQENSTATTATTTGVEEDLNRTKQLDSTTRITNWRYDEASQEFVLTVEADIPQTLTGAESVPRGEGMREASIKQVQLQVGTNVVRIPAEQHNEVAVISVTMTKSITEQRQIIIQSGEQGDDNPLSTLGGTSGVFTGIGVTLTLSLLAAWFVVWRESDGVEVAE